MNEFSGMNVVSDAKEIAIDKLVRMAYDQVGVEVNHLRETRRDFTHWLVILSR